MLGTSLSSANCCVEFAKSVENALVLKRRGSKRRECGSTFEKYRRDFLLLSLRKDSYKSLSKWLRTNAILRPEPFSLWKFALESQRRIKSSAKVREWIEMAKLPFLLKHFQFKFFKQNVTNGEIWSRARELSYLSDTTWMWHPWRIFLFSNLKVQSPNIDKCRQNKMKIYFPKISRRIFLIGFRKCGMKFT